MCHGWNPPPCFKVRLSVEWHAHGLPTAWHEHRCAACVLPQHVSSPYPQLTRVAASASEHVRCAKKPITSLPVGITGQEGGLGAAVVGGIGAAVAPGGRGAAVVGARVSSRHLSSRGFWAQNAPLLLQHMH